MTEETSAGVTEHPLAAMLILGVSAWGAYLLHGFALESGVEHGFFHEGAVRAAVLVAVAAAVVFPVWIARPLLAAAMPVWGRAMVWTLYGAAAGATYGPELRHHGEARESYVIRIEDGMVRREITVVQPMGAVWKRHGHLRDELRARHLAPGAHGPCADEGSGVTIIGGKEIVRIGPGADLPGDAADDAGALERIDIERTQASPEAKAAQRAAADARCTIVIRKSAPDAVQLPPVLPPD